jgi:tyrosine-protein phosphatase YwqE
LGNKANIPLLYIKHLKKKYNNHLISVILYEGAHFQVNASAATNKEDKESHKFVNFLLKNKLVSFVASKVHNMYKRGFYLNEAYRR